MDPIEAARALANAVSEGASLDEWVRPEAMPVAQLLAARPEGAVGLRELDIMFKRNLVFMSYAWVDQDEAQLQTGTWVLSHGRDGRVTHWTAMD